MTVQLYARAKGVVPHKGAIVLFVTFVTSGVHELEGSTVKAQVAGAITHIVLWKVDVPQPFWYFWVMV